MMVTPEAVAQADRGLVEAPAGCGKTHLLADVVARSEGRQLVLTHTHAGVDTIRRRLRDLHVPSTRFHVETLDGFALRYASAFPKTAKLISSAPPRTDAEWSSLRRASAALVQMQSISRVIRASYGGVLVDEYQDCSMEQHALVLNLGRLLPCRIVGDSLQSIFRFRRDSLVNWITNVAPEFPALGRLETPHRWLKEGASSDIGHWLRSVRDCILLGKAIDLAGAPKRSVVWKVLPDDPVKRSQAQQAACRAAMAEAGTVVGIDIQHRYRKLASILQGAYSCIEAVFEKDVYACAQRIHAAHGPDRVVELLAFCRLCMTGAEAKLKKPFERAVARGIGPRTDGTIAECVNELLAVAASQRIRFSRALDLIRNVRDFRVHRKSAVQAMHRAALAVESGEHESLPAALDAVWEQTRRIGRWIPDRALGSTLLVKGMEFDNALVLDADGLESGEHLYVALTRGCRILTVMSRSPVIEAKPLSSGQPPPASASRPGSEPQLTLFG